MVVNNLKLSTHILTKTSNVHVTWHCGVWFSFYQKLQKIILQVLPWNPTVSSL